MAETIEVPKPALEVPEEQVMETNGSSDQLIEISGPSEQVKEEYTNLGNQMANAETPGLDVTGMQNQVQDIAIQTGQETEKKNPGAFVEERVANLLDKDNPLLKRAESRGRAYADAIGLGSTNVGGEIALGSVMNQALKIAQPDAQTAAGFASSEQNTRNQQALTQTEAVVSGKLNQQEWGQQNINQGFQTTLKGLDLATQQGHEKAMQEINNSFQAAQAEADRQLEAALQAQQISASVAESVRAYNSQIIQNHQVAVENLLSNVEFLDLGPEAVASAMNRLANGMQASLTYVNDMAGLGSPTSQWYIQNIRDQFLW